MIDKKTGFLELPLPNEKNLLEDDCPRIAEALTKVDANASAAATRLGELETAQSSASTRLGELETAQSSASTRLGELETAQSSASTRLGELETAQSSTSTRLGELETAQSNTNTQLEEHDANASAHDALVKRITVGSLSPIIGICCVEEGGGAGLWYNIDAQGLPVRPTRPYFDYHPVYSAIRSVLIDGQTMQEHHKFYYKAFEIASGPFAGRRGRLISPGQQDGFKPFPSFMKHGQEIDTWYCGTYQGSLDDLDESIKICSLPDVAPSYSKNFTNLRAYCQNRNVDGVTGFDMWNIYQVSEIQLLALIEACTSDSQSYYGSGNVSGSSFRGTNDPIVATASWRGHVGLWGNVWQACAGLETTSSSTIGLWKNDGSQEWVDTGLAAASNGWYKSIKTGSGEGYDFDDIFYPETVTTTATEATIPDYCYGGSPSRVAYVGGPKGYGDRCGLFACLLTFPASQTNSSVGLGCRLAKT